MIFYNLIIIFKINLKTVSVIDLCYYEYSFPDVFFSTRSIETSKNVLEQQVKSLQDQLEQQKKNGQTSHQLIKRLQRKLILVSKVIIFSLCECFLFFFFF